MRKFIKRMIYRWHKKPQIVYQCKRCGNLNQACPKCHSPTKLLSCDPYKWKCLNCKEEFTMFQMEEAEYFDVDENSKVIEKVK